MYRACCIVGWACAFVLLVGADDAETLAELQAKLAGMRLQKEVLEGQNKIASIVSTLQTIGFSGDGLFDYIRESVEEGNRVLDSISAAETWEEKLEYVKEGLAKRSDWVEQLTALKDAIEEAEKKKARHEEEETEIESLSTEKTQKVKSDTEDTPEKDEMDDPAVFEKVSKVMLKAVRDGNIEMVAKLMSALGTKPAVLAKLVMWADAQTGANLLHWCGFYGKDAHVALAQTFMLIPGVNASVSDKHQHSPCQTACMKNHHEVLEHLMTQHEGSTPCDPFALGGRSTCLHLAAQGGYTKILELLAPRLTRETYELTTSSGTSALALAKESGSAEAVRILSEAAVRLYSDDNKASAKVSDEL